MKSNKKSRVNKQITAEEVRLIDKSGQQIGIVSLNEAFTKAEAENLDLVEISPAAEPPVCRIMDHKKFVFDKKKQKQTAKKKQRRTQIKEIKFRPGTEEGDYQVKLRNLIRFLEEGNKTKITLRFRGREMAHQELGKELLERVENDLNKYGAVEQFPKMEGRQMVMVVAPKRKTEDRGQKSESQNA